MASHSRMFARNWFPSPSPLLAPCPSRRVSSGRGDRHSTAQHSTMHPMIRPEKVGCTLTANRYDEDEKYKCLPPQTGDQRLHKTPRNRQETRTGACSCVLSTAAAATVASRCADQGTYRKNKVARESKEVQVPLYRNTARGRTRLRTKQEPTHRRDHPPNAHDEYVQIRQPLP